MKGVSVSRDKSGRVNFVYVIDEVNDSVGPLSYRVDEYERRMIEPDWRSLPDKGKS